MQAIYIQQIILNYSIKMCMCSPKEFIFGIDEESKKYFAQKLPTLLAQRQQIKIRQVKEQKNWQVQSLVRKADIIFYNGSIYTMEEQQTIVEAIAITKDRIVDLGQQEEIMKWKGPNTTVIDLKQRTFLPGFIDPHIHMVFSSMSHWIQLSPFLYMNMDEVKMKIQSTVANTAQKQWALFQLFDPMITIGTIDVSRKALDQISTTKPIFILQANGHVGHVNSLAFQMAEVTKDSEDPPHGRYIRDQNGELTGQIQQTAISHFYKYIPKMSGADYVNNFEKFISHASSKGCTTLHDCGIGLSSPQTDLAVLHEVFKDPAPVRFCGYLVSSQWDEWVKMKMKPQWKDNQLRVNGVKCWVDGSTQAGSAYLHDPYLKAEWGFGNSNYTQEALNKSVYQAHKSGFQVGIHANGDAGIDMALKAYDHANKLQKKPYLRHRIEHSTVCHKYQLQKMRDLSISPSFLIGHVYYYGAQFRDRILGPQRANLIDPLRSAIDAGLTTSIHSDYNCQPIDPLRCIYNAVTRIMKDNKQILNQSQCIRPYEAIKAMTINAAWQCHMEDIVGSLRKGKFADFVILESDPMKVPENQIKDIKIWQTWKGGEKWYQG